MKTRVLIIDDDPDLKDLMASAFLRAGFETHCAKDGHVGAQLFHIHRPPLVVTDILMPNKEGLEILLELKRQPAAPMVIAISGGGRLGGRDLLAWASQLGADEILLKPFSMATLVATGRRLLGDPASVTDTAQAARAQHRPG